MIRILKAAFAVTLVAVNVCVCGYLGLFFCLSCSRMTTSYQAARMLPVDWVFMAGRRATEAVIVAGALGAFLALTNRLVFAYIFPERERLDWLFAGSPAIIVALGAILGSILFLVEKPYM